MRCVPCRLLHNERTKARTGEDEGTDCKRDPCSRCMSPLICYGTCCIFYFFTNTCWRSLLVPRRLSHGATPNCYERPDHRRTLRDRGLLVRGGSTVRFGGREHAVMYSL